MTTENEFERLNEAFARLERELSARFTVDAVIQVDDLCEFAFRKTDRVRRLQARASEAEPWILIASAPLAWRCAATCHLDDLLSALRANMSAQRTEVGDAIRRIDGFLEVSERRASRPTSGDDT